jgi:hypothetical protein
MLADPYPNAFIRTADGKKLVLTAARIKEVELEKSKFTRNFNLLG